MQMTNKPTVKIEIDAAPKGEWKALGGGDRDEWNERLSNLVTKALPVNQKNAEAVSRAGSAVAAGVMDMKPADPIEGMLMSQLVVVNEASLNMYRLAWLNNAKYFEASTRYLQLADKASRTLAMLTERLDQHRGRGQQQIVVKHVTVNADQAVVTDTVVAGEPAANIVTSPALLTNATEKPIPILEETRKLEQVGGVENGNDQQPHAKRPHRTTVHGPIKADGPGLSCASGPRLSCLSDAWCSRWRTGGRDKRELPAWRPLEGND
jgi:hypothetical protein